MDKNWIKSIPCDVDDDDGGDGDVSIHDNYIHYFQIIIPTNLPTLMVKTKEEVERK